MTIDELILSIEVERDQAVKRRDRAVAAVKAILGKARQEGRANLSEDEDADVKAEFAKRERAVSDLAGIERKLADAQKVRDAEREVDAALEQRAGGDRTDVAPRPSYDRVARVGAEERTYHRGNTGRGARFLRDVVAQHLYRDMEAEQRLIRHMQEERVERGAYLERAVGTGAFAGLTVPQYLTEMYAPAVAARRPFADACNRHDLPDAGMTVNISRITTPTSVALQASENSAVSETNADDTLLTENVQTAAGQQTVSRQAIDRGTGVEDVLMDDLFRRYGTALDSTLLNQASTGLTNVAATTAYTDASPTGPELYPRILAVRQPRHRGDALAALVLAAVADDLDLADVRAAEHPGAERGCELRRAVRVGVPRGPPERHGRDRRQQRGDEPRCGHQRGRDLHRAVGRVPSVGGPGRAGVHPRRAARGREPRGAAGRVRLLRLLVPALHQRHEQDRWHGPRDSGVRVIEESG
jgi:hypothetical protein